MCENMQNLKKIFLKKLKKVIDI